MIVYTHLAPDQTFRDVAPPAKAGFPWISPACRIVIRPEFLKLLCEAKLDRYNSFTDRDLGRTVAESRTTRTSRIVIAPPSAGTDATHAYVKTYYYDTWTSTLKAAARNTWLRSSRARREWRSLLHLRAAGVGAVEPIAVGEHRRPGGFLRSCFLMTLAEPGFVPLADVLAGAAGSDRSRLLRALGRYTADLHEASFSDGNYRFRNLLAAPGGRRGWRFRNLDSPRGRIHRRPPGSGRRSRDLASLDGDARAACSRSERLRFLLAYRGATRLDAAGRRQIEDVRRRTPVAPT